MTGILILGSGGHGKVVADILICRGDSVRGFLDDDAKTWGRTLIGLPVLGPIDSYRDHAPDGLALGIGSNQARQQIALRLGSEAATLWRNAIHPRAIVAASARIGTGVIIAAGAVVNPDALLGDGVIINTGAIVDHDCVIGAYAHIAPGTRLAGGVTVGAGALIGMGASVLPMRLIGEWATVGAGAVVVNDIPPYVTAKGVPARWPTPA